MKIIKYLPLAALAAAAITGCQDDMESFDNRVFDLGASKVQSVLIDGIATEGTASVTASVAKPLDHDIEVTFAADMQKVTAYEEIYSEKAVPLPQANYNIPDPVAMILAGAVSSDPVSVSITGLDQLDRNLVYVLPVSIVSAPIDVISSQQTSFIVIRGAALINVVANINENFGKLSSPGNATELGDISQLTAEALIYVDEFGKLISTVMGIEGQFLLRIGDAGLPDNQLQLATSSGNVTDAAWQLETGKWTALAVTFDSENGEVNVYFNGKKKGNTKTTRYSRAVDWNTSDFYIGKSYDDNRYLDGCISETRVWNRILSEDELNAPNHAYTVSPESDGLVAYWKFNEGSGLTIHDYSNGYDLICNSAPAWIQVELPQ